MLCKTISVFFLLFGRKFFGIVAFRCSLAVSPPQKWRGSPVQKAWSQLNSRRKVFYIKKYGLVCISFNFFLFSHLITYHFAILRFGMYLRTVFTLIFTTYTYQIINMLFGMYFWITTAFVHTKNTYRFVKYRFGMYLQTVFTLILSLSTYQIVITLFGMYLQTVFTFIFTIYTYQIVNMQFGMYFTDIFESNLLYIQQKLHRAPHYILLSLDCHVAHTGSSQWRFSKNLPSSFKNSHPLQLRFPLTIPLPLILHS